MVDKGNDHQTERTLICPFLGKYCIKEECAQHAYLTRVTPQGLQKSFTCGFEAMMIILSEINQKTPMPSQPEMPSIVLPFMGRG